jgi:hypothetical protein
MSPARARDCRRDLQKDVFGRFFRHLEKHIEIPVVIKYAGVDQFVFPFGPRALVIRENQFVIGICDLRVLVQILHVRVGGSAIEVEVVFLHILAMIPLAVCESEQALLQDRIFAIPEAESKTQILLVVGETA